MREASARGGVRWDDIAGVARAAVRPSTLGLVVASAMVLFGSLNNALFAGLTAAEWRIHSLPVNGALLLCSVSMVGAVDACVVRLFGADRATKALVAAATLAIIVGAIAFGVAPAMIFAGPPLVMLIAALALSRTVLVRWAPEGRRTAAGVAIGVAITYLIPLSNEMLDHSFWGQFRADADEFFALTPNSTYGINEDEYRGTRLDLTQEPSGPRLLFLGDSSTYGIGLPSELAFPAVVEAGLGPSATALNAGVPGYNLIESARRYQRFRSWHPDYVFIMDAVHFMTLDRDPHRHRRWSQGPIRQMRGVGFLLMIICGGVGQEGLRPREEYIQMWAATLSGLVAAIISDGGVPVLLVYPWPNIEPKLLEAQVSVARRAGVLVVDLLSAFRGHEKELLFFDGMHPNPEGHRLIGEIIVDVITRTQGRPERIEPAKGLP